MNRTPSFASTRRRLAGSAAHSVFSQHNLRSAAPSSVASSTSAPPAPSEADLFAPVSPSADPTVADADPNTPTANAQPPQTQSAHPQTSPNTASTPPKTPISSTSPPPAGTKPSATPPNTPPTSANGTILLPNTPPTSAQTPPTTPTPGSACSVRPHTDAPCGPSAKLAVVPFATWPTVASHSDTPEAERPHWRARLLEHYSPERQVSFGEHPEWCYSSPRPTLRRLRDQLGSETVVTWLCLQLNYAAQLWGTADGLTSHQLRARRKPSGRRMPNSMWAR